MQCKKKENIDVKVVIEKLEDEAKASYQSLLMAEVALFQGPFTAEEYERAIAANTASVETLYQKLKALRKFLYELDRAEGKSADVCGFEME